MKKLKKLGSMFLALAMALALAIPAMAASATEQYTITAPGNGHKYEVYQIFTAELKKDNGTTELYNVRWGANAKESALIEVEGNGMVSTTILQNFNKPEEHNDFVKNYVDLDGTPYKTVEGSNTVDVEPGYYLIKDADDQTLGANDSFTAYIIKVSADLTIQPKSGVPQFEKKVQDKNDSKDTTETVNPWEDSADYDIGDNVPFQLTATLPTNESIDEYETYTLIFHDLLSEGLEYQKITRLTVNNTNVTDPENYVTKTTGTYKNADGTTAEGLVFTIADAKKLPGVSTLSGLVIEVEYEAQLTGAAVVVGADGNPNKAYLEFSNNPYGEDTSTTPEDKVVVFTYNVVVNKKTKDAEGNIIDLAGANFELRKQNPDGSWGDTIAYVEATPGTQFTFKGLDDGIYQLHESETPGGYNGIEDIIFEITADHETESENPKLISLTVTDQNTGEGKVTFTPDTGAGSASTDVLNLAGVTLPETGGMGTTIFYAVGGVLVLGAVVFLVTKKRVGE